MGQDPLFSDQLPGDAGDNADLAAIRKARKLALLPAKLSALSKRCLKTTDLIHREGLALIWADPDYTPAEAFAAVGKNGYRLVAGSIGTTQFLVQQYALAGVPYTPPALPPDLVLVPVDAEGTLTVVHDPSIPDQ